jgi:hypothetical protein
MPTAITHIRRLRKPHPIRQQKREKKLSRSFVLLHPLSETQLLFVVLYQKSLTDVDDRSIIVAHLEKRDVYENGYQTKDP